MLLTGWSTDLGGKPRESSVYGKTEYGMFCDLASINRRYLSYSCPVFTFLTPNAPSGITDVQGHRW